MRMCFHCNIYLYGVVLILSTGTNLPYIFCHSHFTKTFQHLNVVKFMCVVVDML